MSADRNRVQADLRGLIEGDVLCDELHAQMYASDASVYEIVPIGVVRPRNTEDVQKIVRYADEQQIPLCMRGAGSGLAGQALGSGLILDFSKYMRRLIHLDVENRRVRVQPGMVLADLNRALAQHGLLFGPDPATRSVTTLGSVLAVDTSGSHWPQYGSASDAIESMEVILANGEAASLRKTSWRDPGLGSGLLNRLAHDVGHLLHSNAQTLMDPPWQGVARGCGYRLERVASDSQVDLARLQVGSEGTLTITTEACFRVEPIPPSRGVVLLFFDRLESAARAALEARRDRVAACDLLDRRLLEIARETDPAYDNLLPRGPEAMLLIEQQGDDSQAVRDRLLGLVNRIIRKAPATVVSRITTDTRERDMYWRLCRRVVPRLYRLKGNSRPIPFIDDIAVAPERVPEFLVEVQNVLRTERVTATLFAHAAHGQIHIRPFLDLQQSEDVQKMERLADQLYAKVLEYGGVISGEHALGLSRSWYARQQLGPRYTLCRLIKEWFDPKGILNPGKVISDAPQRVHDHLRTSAPLTRSEILQPSSSNLHMAEVPAGDGPTSDQTISKPKLLPILVWQDTQDWNQVARSCNGCGRCRSNSPGERMCPMFRQSHDEEASPRAKANVFRGLLSGRLPVGLAEADELKAIADLCFQCHQCRLECPASVDIPKIVLEMKAQYVATNGLSWPDKWLTRLDWLAAVASRFPRLANWSLGNPQMRWLLEKSTGIAQGRRLPGIAKQTFLRWASRRRLHRPKRTSGRKVLFFVDQYVNWHNPLLGRALVQVLQHQKVDVYVPSQQDPSWMAKIAVGDIERLRRMIRPNVRLLAEAVRSGHEIVTTEPSAALCLQHEYLQVLDNDDMRLISRHSWEAGQYLWKLHQDQGLEMDFSPLDLSVLYHLPCHLKAIDPLASGMNLLKLIPGLRVQFADAGCSGMAGTFGLKRQNYRNSLRIGWGLISTIQRSDAGIGSTECSACKLQMEQGVDRPTVHPIALLALSYGLLPEVMAWVQRRNRGLVVQ
jgi:FAD/FMN-containing dehydrogenase/Fe-S oxidoreductase